MKKNSLLLLAFILALFYLSGYTLNNVVEKMWLQTIKDYIIYIPTFLISCLLLFLLLIHKNKIFRYSIYLVFFVFLLMNLVYKEINGYGFGLMEARVALAESDFAGDAFSMYFKEISIAFFKALLITFALFVFLEIKAKKMKANVIIVCLSFMFLTYGAISKKGTLSKRFNVVLKVPFNILYSLKGKLYYGPRKEVTIEAKGKKIKNIIYIVDESIRGDILDVNENKNNVSNYLYSIKDSIINFGTASSASNCSAKSNIILMSGMQLNEMPDISETMLKKPNIFQYANASGYNTVFINNQPTETQNFLTKHDFKNIDTIYTTVKIYPNKKLYDMDITSIDFISSELASNKSNFFYINKYGSHFHYENCYPKEMKLFSPILEEKEWGNDKEKLNNSYKNSLNWSVDYYFNMLINKLGERDDTIIIYTADHGQNLGEDENLKTSHCNTVTATKYEASVPLFLLPLGGKLKNELLSKMNYNNYNKTSHFNLFPTIMTFMGYSNIEGKTLFDKQDETRSFISGDLFNRSNMYIKKEFVLDK
ncbi:sulfatase-like hydrolase/transferase [Tenacibaculum sp. nBUS_03]|uniref:sulfatase-like hydrolase/transferase n=1 Tax=Tenacibaculum sp. nBUS_03 TaxID=3395320 RepID=UPI003EBA18C7